MNSTIKLVIYTDQLVDRGVWIG